MGIGERIKERREALRMSQDELAQKVGYRFDGSLFDGMEGGAVCHGDFRQKGGRADQYFQVTKRIRKNNGTGTH